MHFSPVTQPAFNTSIMGVIKGVVDYFGIPLSDAVVFGTTGHAFLINIHDVICPSGPYCWNHEGMFQLMSNLGITVEDLGFYQPDSAPEERNRVERMVKAGLDRGKLCSVLNMDHQLVSGYNDTHLFLCVPWPEFADLTPSKLTFGTWEEYGEDYHCQFYSYDKTGGLQLEKAIRASLFYALEMFKTPEKYCAEPYALGLTAYDQWCEALREGHGRNHGNFWNATVWSECRIMAAKYLDEIGHRFGNDIKLLTQQISATYWVIAQNLDFVGSNRLDDGRKIDILKETKDLEAGLIPKIESLASIL